MGGNLPAIPDKQMPRIVPHFRMIEHFNTLLLANLLMISMVVMRASLETQSIS
jgi:hypothetical protein